MRNDAAGGGGASPSTVPLHAGTAASIRASGACLERLPPQGGSSGGFVMSTLYYFILTPLAFFSIWLYVRTSLTMPAPYTGQRTLPISNDMISAVAQFPPDFSTGQVRLNDALKSATRLFDGKLTGCACIEVSEDGHLLFTVDIHGYLHIVELPKGRGFFPLRAGHKDPKLRANVTYLGPGRPLGLKLVDHSTKLLVADSLKGLLEVDLAGVIALDEAGMRFVHGGKAEHHHHSHHQHHHHHHIPIDVLANRDPDGAPLNHINSVDVCPQTGMVFFSSSSRHPVTLGESGFYDVTRSYTLNTLHGSPSGRIFSYDRGTKELRVVEDGIWFPHGVAVSHDGSSVLYAEVSAFRLRRKRLSTGEVENVLDHLPAMPASITRSPKGTFWLALVAPVSPMVFTLPHPLARLVLSYFTKLIRLLARSQGLVVEVSSDGSVIRSFGDPKGEVVASVACAKQVGSVLYMGNMMSGSYVSSFELPHG
eukprot:TRINITY_DN74746_c0_g1_i1.p1 TRINITY_DN74746_c0_g1~~TRINITY_DN74746_c0_g1_i1.p1  ORF type:complete len:486 (+),score=140.63 TRINITY_DN74746_c0_g1_i1:23-1459(+)